MLHDLSCTVYMLYSPANAQGAAANTVAAFVHCGCTTMTDAIPHCVPHVGANCVQAL